MIKFNKLLLGGFLMALPMILQATDYREIGIFILPDTVGIDASESLSQAIKRDLSEKDIPFTVCDNSPHISIFQGVFSDEGVIALQAGISAIAKEAAAFTLTVNPALKDTKENVFWNVSGDVTPANKISDAFYAAGLHDLREKDQLMEQVTRDIKEGISDLNAELTAKYGLYWNVPEKGYNPHITLVYGSNTNDGIAYVLTSNEPEIKTVTCDRIAIGELGFDGNLVKVLHTVKLRNLS